MSVVSEKYMKHCSSRSYNSYLNYFCKRAGKDVKRLACQKIVGYVCGGARKGNPASSFCVQQVSYCPEGALALRAGFCGIVLLPLSLAWLPLAQSGSNRLWGKFSSFASLLDSPVVLFADRKSLSLSPFLRALLLAEMGHVTTLNHSNRAGARLNDIFSSALQ